MVTMEGGFSLKTATVGILGLGLMGGSLALSLKGKCKRLLGFDSHPPTLELALSKGIIDHALPHPQPLSQRERGVDILILATPVPSIIQTINQLPSIHPPCIVMDIGSTKRDILEAMSQLPAGYDPIGGHPICGRETLGLQNADANLYQGAPFVITPLPRTTLHALRITKQILSAIGADLIEMTAADHDRILAFTSHLPFLLASSLARSTLHATRSTPLIGPGFRSTSRLAGTPAHMMLGILKSNRDNMLDALHGMQAQLAELEAALSSEDFAKLESLLNEARTTYQSLTGN